MEAARSPVHAHGLSQGLYLLAFTSRCGTNTEHGSADYGVNSHAC